MPEAVNPFALSLSKGVFLAMALSMAAWAAAASAQTYPNKPVRLVVPFAPGGFTDAVARILAKSLGDSLTNGIIKCLLLKYLGVNMLRRNCNWHFAFTEAGHFNIFG